MGVDLFGRGRSCSLNWGAWRKLLGLAQLFGWRPAGPVTNPDYDNAFDILRRPEEADALTPVRVGDYFSNDGDMVTAADAEALADALERALRNPNQPAVRNLLSPDDTDEIAEILARHFGPAVKSNEELVRDFIAFCRGGRFIIL